MLNSLLEAVKSAIFNSPNTPHQPGNDPDGLIGQIEGLFGQQQYVGGGYGGGSMQSPLPASQDPYGDPADSRGGGRGFGNVRPASEDPYGDPADQR